MSISSEMGARHFEFQTEWSDDLACVLYVIYDCYPKMSIRSRRYVKVSKQEMLEWAARMLEYYKDEFIVLSNDVLTELKEIVCKKIVIEKKG